MEHAIKRLARAGHRKFNALVRFYMKDQWRRDGRCIWCGSGEVVYDKQGSSPMWSVRCQICGHKYDA